MYVILFYMCIVYKQNVCISQKEGQGHVIDIACAIYSSMLHVKKTISRCDCVIKYMYILIVSTI